MSIREEYTIESIDHFQCREWLLYKHYAKRLPSIEYSFGLFSKNILVGVITFGQPPSPTLKESICGKDFAPICIELNRLVVNDGLGKNTLSHFVSSAIKKLPKPKIIVSFSDKNQGHQGYIYQATNWLYTGLSSNDEILVDKDGNEFHFRKFGHKRKENHMNCKLVKRRVNEKELNRLEIANYLKSHKGGFTAKELDKIFGYKDTASHWFRTDSGFSFPSVDDWHKLKELLSFDSTYDDVMTKFELVPDRKEQIEKLGLKAKKVENKHRYVYFIGSKKEVQKMKQNLKHQCLPYPKGQNSRYDSSYKPTIQTTLF